MHRPPRAGAPTAQRHAPVRTRRVGPSRAPHPCGSRAHRRTGGARRPGVPPTARAPDASVTGTGAGRRSNDPSPVDRSVAGAQLRQMRVSVLWRARWCATPDFRVRFPSPALDVIVTCKCPDHGRWPVLGGTGQPGQAVVHQW